jgi:hypothetical protein
MKRSFTINLDLELNDSIDLVKLNGFIQTSLYKGLDRSPLYVAPDKILSIEVKDNYLGTITRLLSEVKKDIIFKNIPDSLEQDNEELLRYYGEGLRFQKKHNNFHGKIDWINGYQERTYSYDNISISEIISYSTEETLKEIIKQIEENL